MSHTCHAKGCKRQIPPKLLFCLPHWRRVPKLLHAAVWRTYREGQEITKDPSAEYMDAQRAAIAAVAALEERDG